VPRSLSSYGWKCTTPLRPTCVVAVPGSSHNLRWELRYLRESGWHEKLFIVTTPDRDYDEGSRWRHLRRLGRFLRHGSWKEAKGPQPLPWEPFARSLQATGYTCLASDPGPGAVVGFEADGQAIVLATNARHPTDFVEPIRRKIAPQNAALRPVAPAFGAHDTKRALPTGGPRHVADLAGQRSVRQAMVFYAFYLLLAYLVVVLFAVGIVVIDPAAGIDDAPSTTMDLVQWVWLSVFTLGLSFAILARKQALGHLGYWAVALIGGLGAALVAFPLGLLAPAFLSTRPTDHAGPGTEPVT